VVGLLISKKVNEVLMTSDLPKPNFPVDAGCCQIRPFRVTDRNSLVLHANNQKVSRNLDDRFPYPYTLADADDWIARTTSSNPLTCCGITVADEVVGGIGLLLQEGIHRHCADLGYWLGERVWNRGIATAAVRAFTRYGFQAFDLRRIYAGVFSCNPASMRVLEKAGFLREGVLRQSVVKDKQILDLILYAFTRDMLAESIF
jgi:[ribosomal protein S5]-alanine N-acetyltransferase